MDIIEILVLILKLAESGASTSILWSFVIGAIYGLTCIQCVLPIVFYGSAEGNIKRGILFAIYFNIPRLVLFLLLAIMAAVSASIFLSIKSLPDTLWVIFNLFTGSVLILFSAELFGLFDFDRVIVLKLTNLLEPFIKPLMKKNFSTHWYGAFLRGFLFSICCALESIALVFAIWFLGFSDSLAFKDSIFAFMAILSYGIGNVLSTTIIGAFMGGSTGLIENKTKLKIRRYVSIFGSLIMLFLGLNFIAYGIAFIL